MNESTPTSASNTSPPVEGLGAAAPALAYVNPQPRLPHSEASPPEQPETFMRRARRVRVGSSRLKLWYLALCTFGRAWTRGEDVLEIGIKQRSLAGELETGLNRVSKVLAELRDTGLVDVSRSKYHSVIRIFLTPQSWPDTPETGVSEKAVPLPVTPETGVTREAGLRAPGGRDTPETGVSENPVTPVSGVPDTPETGVTNVFRSFLDVQQQQQEQQQHARARADPEPDSLNPSPPGREPTEKQLSGIASMAAELGIPVPNPHDRLAADVVFRELKERVNTRRAAVDHGPTEKQLSGIISMAAELGIPAPEPADRLAADAVFQELREKVEAQRTKRRTKRGGGGPERPHVIEYSQIDRQSRCRVCGAWNPNPRGECGGV